MDSKLRKENITAIILAGGFGKRINGPKNKVPKPMIKVGKHNLLEHNLLNLKRAGIRNFIISTGDKDKTIKNYFGDGAKYKINIEYKKDPYPLGDAGAFKYCFPNLEERVILANADEIRIGLDLEKMFESHIKNKSMVTMAIIKQQDKENHGIVEIDKEKKIEKFIMNPSLKETSSCYANSGIYFIEKEALNYFKKDVCMMKDVLKGITNSGKMYGFIFRGVYFNVGTSKKLISLGFAELPYSIEKVIKNIEKFKQVNNIK